MHKHQQKGVMEGHVFFFFSAASPRHNAHASRAQVTFFTARLARGEIIIETFKALGGRGKLFGR